MRPMMALPHDLRCIPTSLANKIPAASISRGGYRGGKTVPPPVTTSPIDRPFDRRGRPRLRQSGRAQQLVALEQAFLRRAALAGRWASTQTALLCAVLFP